MWNSSSLHLKLTTLSLVDKYHEAEDLQDWELKLHIFADWVVYNYYIQGYKNKLIYFKCKSPNERLHPHPF